MSKHNQNDTYLKICVLQNNKADYEDAPLKKREVKEIFANHRQLNFDIEHSHNYLSGIDIIENYISKTNETIMDTTIPKGSWIMTLNITNPTVLSGIQNGDITGVSLETDFTNDIITTSNDTILPYRDVVNKEEMIPHVVSFTGSPANQLPIEVMTHKQYTMKSKNQTNKMGSENMTTTNNNENKISEESELGFLRKLFAQHFTQHTSKNMTAPVSQPTTNTGFNTEELINSLIETQKLMPTLTKTLETVANSQNKMTESFNNLNLKFDEFIMKQSTDTMDETENQATTKSTDNEENTEQEDISGKENTTTPENTTTGNDNNTTKQEGNENSQKETEEDNRKKQHTSKTSPVTQRPHSFQTNNNNGKPAPENYIRFLYNRSYENFMNE